MTVPFPAIPAVGFLSDQIAIHHAIKDYLDTKTNVTWSYDIRDDIQGMLFGIGAFKMSAREKTGSKGYAPKIVSIPIVLNCKYKDSDSLTYLYGWVDYILYLFQTDLYQNGHVFNNIKYFNGASVVGEIEQGFFIPNEGGYSIRALFVLEWEFSSYNRRNVKNLG